MRWIANVYHRMRYLFRRPAVEHDLDEELRFHLERQVEENIAAGMTPEQARGEARRALGGVAQIKEECRDVRKVSLFEDALRDLQYGLRMMRRSPGFTAAALVSLALGIGANTAIFTVVNAVLLRPLPFPDAQRLVLVSVSNPVLPFAQATLSIFRAWKEQNRSLEQIACFTSMDFTLTGIDEPAILRAALVSADFFPLLGIQPYRGRVFTRDEDVSGNNQVALVSYGLWQRIFGGDASAIGRRVVLNQKPFTIIGVLPPGFRFLPAGDAEIWAPESLDQAPPREANTRWYLDTVGRLKPGVTAEQARADLGPITHGANRVAAGAVVTPMQEQLVRTSRRSLLLLLGAVTFVLLIACGNVANLQSARAASRAREIAIRAALGAGRRRVIRQLLAESVLLALAAGCAGLVVAHWGAKLLVRLGAAEIPKVNEAGIDGWVLGFTFAVSLLAGVLFGLGPAVQASRTDLNATLKEAGRPGTAGAGQGKLRRYLVVAEVALALVLLVGAGLMLHSLWRLWNADPGFRAENVLAMRIDLPWQRYSRERREEFYRELLAGVQTLPRVEAAGLVNQLPMGGSPEFAEFVAEGAPPSRPGESGSMQFRVVSPDYFRALGIPLRRGRFFDDRDTETAPKVAIVNETLERRYFGGNALGRRLRSGGKDEPWMEVVGVVGDVRHTKLSAEPLPERYVPLGQMLRSRMMLAVRASGDPLPLAASIQRVVHELDRDVPVSQIQTMEQRRSNALGMSWFLIFLLAAFAGLALVLACLGGYSVMNYAVAQRTHEIGVRMALGASGGEVLRMVLRDSLALVAAGVAIGLVLALSCTRLLSGFLFGVTPSDPLALFASAAAIVLAALLAAYLPARRAGRVDPMAALRHE